MECRLSELSEGVSGSIRALTLQGGMRRRLLDLGFVPGTRVTALLRGPDSCIRAYGICGSVIALRRSEAAQILLSI